MRLDLPIATTIALAISFGMVSYGVWLWHQPLGYIVGGFLSFLLTIMVFPAKPKSVAEQRSLEEIRKVKIPQRKDVN